MSDTQSWSGGSADDPFAPDTVEAAIARSLRPDTPATRDTLLVRTLADAYTLPPPTDAALARGRARLAQRAEALGTGGQQMITSDPWQAPTRSISPTPAMPGTRPPRPPRRRLSPLETFLRTAAAVLVVALLAAGFYALFHATQRHGTAPQPTPMPTHTSISATATPTPIPPPPPAPAGIYVTGPDALFLLDLSTGAVKHRYPYTSSGHAIVGTPVVANGAVYYTELDSSSGQASVVALSASSGALLWRTQTAGQLLDLSLAGGTLYGGTAGTGTGSDTFYALRASDGSVLWTYQTATLRPPAVIAGGVVYLKDQPANPTAQHIRALRASDGSQLWDTPLPQACTVTLSYALDQGMIFVSCGTNPETGQGDNGIFGLQASDGTVLWHIATNGEPLTLAAGAGLVYVSLYTNNAPGALDALDETSGAVRWHVPNGGGWPVFDGTTVYAGVGSDLAAFSASSGAVLWTFPEANQRIELDPPVIAGGVVYQILDEQVVAISAASGSVLWHSPALSSPQVGLRGLAVVTGG